MASSTPTPSSTPSISSEVDNELKSQYTGLSDDLKKYFDSRLKEFLEKSKGTYSDPSNYYKDRGEFLVDQQISNLENYRNQIWGYLKSEFNTNTSEKYLNAKTINQNQREIARRKKDFEELDKKYNQFKSKKNIHNREKEIAIYELHRRNDQLYIMKIIAVVLLLCLLITFIIYMDALPYFTIFVVFTIFGILILYIIYYMYFTNPGRSKRYWDKKYFLKPSQETKKTSEEIDYVSVDKKLDDEFNKYLEASCAKPTTGPTTAPTTAPTQRA
jgi:hypothetical protein